MSDDALKTMLRDAKRAVENAQQVRAHHRRRTSKTSSQRQTDIQVALDRLRQAMKPLKSEIGRYHFGAQSKTTENDYERILDASDAVQRERRKLWKMRPPKPKPTEA